MVPGREVNNRIDGQLITDKRAWGHQRGDLLIFQHRRVDIKSKVEGIKSYTIGPSAVLARASITRRRSAHLGTCIRYAVTFVSAVRIIRPRPPLNRLRAPRKSKKYVRPSGALRDPLAVADAWRIRVIRLSKELLGGGWPLAALVDLLVQQAGVGELRLLRPALSARDQGAVAMVNPPHQPDRLGFSYIGLPLDRLMLVRGATTADALWSVEQSSVPARAVLLSSGRSMLKIRRCVDCTPLPSPQNHFSS